MTPVPQLPQTGPQQRPVLPKKRHAPVVGIDFGTSYSSVGVVRDGKIEMVRFEDGEPMLPSVVSFPAPDVVLVGAEARARMGAEAQFTIASPKRLLGRPFGDPEVARITGALAFRSFAGSDRFLRLEAHDRIYSMTDICAMILEKLRERAKIHTGQEITECVMAAPVGFGSLQRSALERAARQAGMKVLGILSEPTAAVMAHGLPKKFNGRVAVYDFGGGTFDFNVLQVSESAYQVLSSGGDPWLGGDDFDDLIANHVADAFWRQTEIDLRKRAVEWQALLVECEQAKRTLTKKRSTDVSLDGLVQMADGARGLSCRISRKDFNGLTRPLVKRSLAVVERVLNHARLSPQDVEAVVLTGGTSMIPAVRRAVSKVFGAKPALADAHLAVVTGATIEAANKGGVELEYKSRMVHEVAGRIFGASVEGGHVVTLFERDTPLPAERKESFATLRDNQQEMVLSLFEQNTSRVDESRPIGKLYLRGLPAAPAGRERIDVTFILDEDGMFTVAANVAGKEYKQSIRTR
ncbi:MAG: Hsp70 family protein [Myxococcales bacterium]|nr:Hsp70 family protein [Myxococcales bacterium]